MTDYTITYRSRGGLSTWEAYEMRNQSHAITMFVAHNFKYTGNGGYESIVSVEEGTCSDADNQ